MNTRAIVVVIMALIIVGCASDRRLELLKESLDLQLKIEESRERQLLALSSAPSGNRSAEEGVAYQMRLFDLQQNIAESRTDIVGPMLNYDYKMTRLPWDIGMQIWNSPNTGLILCQYPLDCARNNGGSNVVVKADRGSTVSYSGTSGSKSPYIKGDEASTGYGSSIARDDGTAANRDGQIMDGQGNTQQQVGTDPISGTRFDEGENQNFLPNSSTGIDGSL